MKKFFIVLILTVFVCLSLTLTSCKLIRWLGDDWLTKNQREITDEAMLRLCRAIKKKDAKELKALFSYSDIESVEGFDESVQELFEYIKGEPKSFEFVSSGSDMAAMGGYPREREFGGVNYKINTASDTYKVVFGYRSYYNIAYDKSVKEKIGFEYFDIINAKDDRTTDIFYSGCPFRPNGINIGYLTVYSCPEECGVKVAYSQKVDNTEGILIENMQELASFYQTHNSIFDLSSRKDGFGFEDICKDYGDCFFDNHTLLLIGINFGNDAKNYVPQYVYINDFIYADIAYFEPNDEIKNAKADGIIILIELPMKLSRDTRVILDIYDAYTPVQRG